MEKFKPEGSITFRSTGQGPEMQQIYPSKKDYEAEVDQKYKTFLDNIAREKAAIPGGELPRGSFAPVIFAAAINACTGYLSMLYKKYPGLSEFEYQEFAAKLACHKTGLDEKFWYPIYLLGHWWNDIETWAEDILTEKG